MKWFIKCLKQYADFNGRARRREFGMFILFRSLLFIAVLWVGNPSWAWVIRLLFLSLLLPGWAVAARRLHDVGRGGWFILPGIIGGLWLSALDLIFTLPDFLMITGFICFLIGLCVNVALFIRNSQPGTNRYGPNPKDANADNQPVENGRQSLKSFGEMITTQKGILMNTEQTIPPPLDDKSQGGSAMKTPQIAIIGTEGSGKTVLITVLAKKLATPLNGIWLNPQGVKTGKYIEQTWNTLRKGEWIPSTPAGTLFQLKWKMQVGDRECPVQGIDSAGQDLRRLFSDEGYKDPNLSEQDRQFISYLHDSTIVLVLVNLRDILGEPDEDRVIENIFTLKGILDKLQEDKAARQVAFLFTAYDLYEASIEGKYGNVWNFFERELPYLYHAHIAGKPVKCFPVAAVTETETKIGEDGIARRVPAPDFRSQGLDPLIQWLAEAVAGDMDRHEQKEIAAQQKKKRKTMLRIMMWLAIAAAVALSGWCVVAIAEKWITAAEQAARAAAEQAAAKEANQAPRIYIDKWYCEGSGFLWGNPPYDVTADVTVFNPGTNRTFRIRIEVGGKSGSEVVTVEKNGRGQISNIKITGLSRSYTKKEARRFWSAYEEARRFWSEYKEQP